MVILYKTLERFFCARNTHFLCRFYNGHAKTHTPCMTSYTLYGVLVYHTKIHAAQVCKNRQGPHDLVFAYIKK